MGLNMRRVLRELLDKSRRFGWTEFWRRTDAMWRVQQKKEWALAVVLLVLGGGVALVPVVSIWAEGDAKYTVVMSKNDRLCTHMRAVLNEGLEQHGPGYDVRKFMAPIFSAISWKPIGLDEGFDYGGAVARFDINNDGTTDVVVRQETSGLKDKTFQRLFVFEEGQYAGAARKRRELEEKAIGSVDFYMSRYDFLGLPPKILQAPPLMKGKKSYVSLWVVYIHPFRFEGVTYLMISRSPDLAPEYGPEPYWTLVAKYKQGKVHGADPSLMEDICYLK